MKIILKNISDCDIPYLMKCDGEKVGYIYFLKPQAELECLALHTHKDGLVCQSSFESIYSLSYENFDQLQISYVKRK